MSTVIDGSASVTINSGAILGITSGTAQATNTGAVAYDFTALPSWVKRITVMFNGVSTNGTSNLLIQLGYQSPVTSSGYNSYGMNFGGGSGAGTNSTAGFIVKIASAAAINSGLFTISTLGSNVWVMQGMVGDATNINGYITSGGVTLSGTLDRVRITTVGGTDTFDAGSINILYEG